MNIFRRLLLLLSVVLIASVVYLYYRLHDRYPDFQASPDFGGGSPGRISAGFAAIPVTPAVPDTWTDHNGDAMYNEKDGDTYTDGNGNGCFDPVWLAGFQNNRPATGIHDELWSRAMIVDDGSTRVAWVALDLIGFGADDVNEVKAQIPSSWGISYTFITSTHTHEGPDVVGMWGKSELRSGVNQDYLQKVKEKIVLSIGEAVARMRPATIVFAQDTAGAKSLVADYRKPEKLDYGLRLMHFRDTEADTTLGTLIQWANHPETLWAGNLEITSDFPHYLREAFENGIYSGDSLICEGKKGITLFVNGAIGGMMSTGTEFPIPDIKGDTNWTAPVFEKARAQGEQLAWLALKALNHHHSAPLDSASIRLGVRKFDLPLDNKLYRLGAAAGIFNRGLSGWWKIRTEIAFWTLGPASFLHQPGELYPEIANGGTEAPEGRDYPVPPSQNIPLRSIMPGEYRFIAGLSNDFIGYILPLSQWDEKAPYTYDQREAPYGEINSVGPQTAPILYDSIVRLVREFNK
jgi:hypothetical protein